MTGPADWHDWHRRYEDPEHPLRERLGIIQRLIRAFLDQRPQAEVRVVSICAGQGRDLLEVLADHRSRVRVKGRLVELDPANADIARSLAQEAGADGIEVVTGDASVTDVYLGAVPADLVLVCGVFGNISDSDVERTVCALPQFCAQGATVIWTRHRHEPDLTPRIHHWLEAAGFEQLSFESTTLGAFTPDGGTPVQSVGVHRWPHQPVPLKPGQRLFTFLP
jgi:Putative methyltransferase